MRVGAAGTAGLRIGNGATGALTAALIALPLGATGGFALGSAPGPIAAGSDNALSVHFDTSRAGIYSGTASIGFVSRNPVLSDLDLGSSSVALSLTVNNHAAPTFLFGGQALTYDVALGSSSTTPARSMRPGAA